MGGQVLKLAAAGAASLVVFGGSVAGFMMAKGELNSKGLQKLPVVGSFLAGDEAESETPPESPEGSPPNDPPPEQEETRSPETFQSGGEGADLFQFPDGFSLREVTDLVGELKGAKEDFETRSQAAETERRRQGVEREELLERRDALENLLEEIRLGRAELERETERFFQDRVRYESSEQGNVKKLAKNFEQMDPEEAARGMGEMDDDDVVKILSEMSSRKAGKLMAAFDAERLARIAKKMKGLVADTDSKKNEKE